MSNKIYLHARKRGHSVVENNLLDDANLTGMAKYLLIQFCSHRQGEWKINMKDIIKRSKNGRDAHYNALKELIINKYIARIRVMNNGLHHEQIYIYGQIKEDVQELLEETVALKESEGFTCWVEFGPPHPEKPDVDSERSESPELPHPEKPYTEKPYTENQDNIKYQQKKYQSTNLNNRKEYIDDDKRTSPSESSAAHSEEELNMIISTLRKATEDELTNRSFKSVLRKVMDKYNQGKVHSFRDYLMTALAKKIEELELRRVKEAAKSATKQPRRLDQIENEIKEYKHSGDLPFYNWLEE